MPRAIAAAVIALLGLAAPAQADMFAPAEHFPAGIGPQFPATGDFNRDGDRDLVVAGTAGGSVLLGGHGVAFGPPVALGLGGDAEGVAVADLNGDGDQDLAFARDPGGLFIVMRGGGTFGAPAHEFGNRAKAVAPADFNRDGDPDLAVLDIALAQGLGSGLLGGPGATFQRPITSHPAGLEPRAVAVTDVDQDRDQDLAALSAGAVTVMLGDGTGSLAPQPAVDTGGGTPESIATGDFNGDGDPDLAVANRTGDDVSLWFGGPAATFGAQTRLPLGIGSAPSGVVTADFDADGDFDLAITCSGRNSVEMLLGNGDGTFALHARQYVVGSAPLDLVADDFNADGRPDLATVNLLSDSVSVLINSATPEVEAGPSRLTFASQPQATISAPRTITVANTGDRALRVQRVRTVGQARDDFLVTSDGCRGELVGPRRSCAIVVRFAPGAAGLREANLQIDSDALVNSTFDVPLNGTGGALPRGADGPAGPAGGSVVAATRGLLAAVFASDRQTARASSRLRVRYVSTMDAVVTVELRRGRRLVRRLSATAVAGRNSLSLRVPARGGRYTLALTAVAADQRVTDAARLTVLRRRA